MTIPDNNTQTCQATGCTNPPTHQYRQQRAHSNHAAPEATYTHSYFTCDTHAYTDPLQATGTHTDTCMLIPCDCTPTQPVEPPLAPMQ